MHMLSVRKKYKLAKGGINLNILKWIGAVVLFFWILGIIFRIGGMFIHWLLVIAAIVFIVDFFMGKKTLQ